MVMGRATFLTILAVTFLGFAYEVTSACKDPDDIETLMSYADIKYSLHWSFLNSPTSRDALMKNLSLFIPEDYSFFGPIEGDRTKKNAKMTLKGNGGNLCPAIYKNESDEDRIPETIKQAVCLCRKCLMLGRKLRKKFRCEKVMTHAPVYRRDGCKNGRWNYKQVFEPVAVACSCNLRAPRGR